MGISCQSSLLQPIRSATANLYVFI